MDKKESMSAKKEKELSLKSDSFYRTDVNTVTTIDTFVRVDSCNIIVH
jgi:hypothetical protein